MGLLEEFGVKMDEVKEASWEVEDGTYAFEITEDGFRRGTKNKPQDTFYVITYNLDEAGTKQEWFTIAINGDTDHPRAKQSQSFLKTRLKTLGFDDIEEGGLEGVRGILTLKSKKGPKGTFQNLFNVTVTPPTVKPGKAVTEDVAAVNPFETV